MMEFPQKTLMDSITLLIQENLVIQLMNLLNQIFLLIHQEYSLRDMGPLTISKLKHLQ